MTDTRSREDKEERTARLRALIGKRKASDKDRRRKVLSARQKQAQGKSDARGVQGIHEAL